jgi:hypothetical protein
VELALWPKNQAREAAVNNASVEKLLERMEFTPCFAASAPQPATLLRISIEQTDDTLMEGVDHGSYVWVTLQGKATRQCSLFSFCLDDASICKGVLSRSCLCFTDKEPPSITEVHAEKVKFNTTELGLQY